MILLNRIDGVNSVECYLGNYVEADAIIWDGDEKCQKQLEIAAIGDYDLGFTSFHYLIMAQEGLHSFGSYNLNRYYRIFADKKYDADKRCLLCISWNIGCNLYYEYDQYHDSQCSCQKKRDRYATGGRNVGCTAPKNAAAGRFILYGRNADHSGRRRKRGRLSHFPMGVK